MAPTEEIRRKTEACQSLFANCLSNQLFLDMDWLEDRRGEFNLWIASLKAASIGRASLDYRVRDHVEIRELICDLLDGLLESLDGLLQIAEPSDLNPISEAEKKMLLQPEDDAGSIFSSFSTDEGDTDLLPCIGKVDCPLSEHMFYNKTILGALARVSKVIRQSGAKFRFQRADMSLKETDYEDFKTELSITILLGRVVADTGEWDNANTIGLQFMHGKPLTKVQDRLVRANIVRRNRILFATQSMGRPGIPAAQQRSVILAEVSAATHESTTKVPHNPIEQVPNRPVVAPQAPSIEMASTATTATEIGSKLNFQHAVHPKSSAPSVITRATRIAADQDYPNCPKPISDKIIQCPYCADMLSVTYSKNQSSWRGHVAQDILPYMCIYENCETSDNMYLTADDLSKHMCDQHGVKHWVCDYCASKSESGHSFVFNVLADWESHMKTSHIDVHTSQLPSLAKVSQRRMLEALTYPLCEYAAENHQPTLNDHIAKHLHEFALRCLPWGTGDDERDSVNARILVDQESTEITDAGSKDGVLAQLDLTEADSPLQLHKIIKALSSRLAGKSGSENPQIWPYGAGLKDRLLYVLGQLRRCLSITEASPKAQADHLTQQRSHLLPLADLYSAQVISPRENDRMNGHLQSFNLDLTPDFPEPGDTLLEDVGTHLLKIIQILHQALLRWGVEQPSDPFELYCQRNRPILMANGEEDPISIEKKLARRWADLPGSQVTYFTEQSELDKKNFEDYIFQTTQDTESMLEDELGVLEIAVSRLGHNSDIVIDVEYHGEPNLTRDELRQMQNYGSHRYYVEPMYEGMADHAVRRLDGDISRPSSDVGQAVNNKTTENNSTLTCIKH